MARADEPSDTEPHLAQGGVIDGDICGREFDLTPCGQPASIWVLLGGDRWQGSAATACSEHADELLAHPRVVLSSDAPLYTEDDPR